MSERAVNDASGSVRGTIYQFWIALKKCFEMMPGEKILIERLGDVTKPDVEQIEVKHHQSPLTDSHVNFWKTVKNWLSLDFDPQNYRWLVLLTTQPIGANSRFVDWNDASAEQRLQIMQKIHSEAEERFKFKSGANKGLPTESLKLQRQVMSSSNDEKLAKIASRLVIESDYKQKLALITEIKQRYLRGIPESAQDDCLNSLIGNLINSDNQKDQSWEVSSEQFNALLRQAHSTYRQDTYCFPRKYISKELPSSEDINKHAEHLFVAKIKEIDYEEEVPGAVRDYLAALITVDEEFKRHAVPRSRTENYLDELVETFKKRHRIACRSAACLEDAKTFYDSTMSEEPRKFEGFDVLPIQFRNGLLHAQMDDEAKRLKWKLENE